MCIVSHTRPISRSCLVEIGTIRNRNNQRILTTPRESAAPLTNIHTIALRIASHERCAKHGEVEAQNELEIQLQVDL